MPERFDRVPDDDVVFRLVEENSSFLPAGARLPLPVWFTPSSEDVSEGERRQRAPGWSVWNRSIASVAQVKTLVERPDSLAFGLKAGAIREVAKTHERALDVLADPADDFKPTPGWDAHCVVEGLVRPAGVPKTRQKDLQADLAARCSPAA